MADAIDHSCEPSHVSATVPHLVGVTPPPGLHAIYTECRRIYPEQPNPLQVTAVVKYWYVISLLYGLRQYQLQTSLFKCSGTFVVYSMRRKFSLTPLALELWAKNATEVPNIQRHKHTKWLRLCVIGQSV
jgi:hypothetical protein